MQDGRKEPLCTLRVYLCCEQTSCSQCTCAAGRRDCQQTVLDCSSPSPMCWWKYVWSCFLPCFHSRWAQPVYRDRVMPICHVGLFSLRRAGCDSREQLCWHVWRSKSLGWRRVTLRAVTRVLVPSQLFLGQDLPLPDPSRCPGGTLCGAGGGCESWTPRDGVQALSRFESCPCAGVATRDEVGPGLPPGARQARPGLEEESKPVGHPAKPPSWHHWSPRFWRHTLQPGPPRFLAEGWRRCAPLCSAACGRAAGAWWDPCAGLSGEAVLCCWLSTFDGEFCQIKTGALGTLFSLPPLEEVTPLN